MPWVQGSTGRLKRLGLCKHRHAGAELCQHILGAPHSVLLTEAAKKKHGSVDRQRPEKGGTSLGMVRLLLPGFRLLAKGILGFPCFPKSAGRETNLRVQKLRACLLVYLRDSFEGWVLLSSYFLVAPQPISSTQWCLSMCAMLQSLTVFVCPASVPSYCQGEV